MYIGDAARRSGISAKLIRYYEEISLIRPAGRTESGYRDYSDADVHSLQFIRRARSLGFSIERIGRLIGLWNDKARASADVKAIALDHVAELETKIAEMQAMVDTLRTLADHCHGNSRPDCPILADLSDTKGTACRHKQARAAPA